MQYLVRTGELKQEIDYDKKLLKSIEDNIDYLNSLKASLVWTGQAYSVFIPQYDNYIEELKKIALNIVILINYLSAYCNNYGYEYLRLSEKYKNITDWRLEHGND